MTKTPFLALFGAWCGLVVGPAALAAQQALVYCPVGVDVAGCDLIVEALTGPMSAFPGGVARGYDGTSGTVDLASADLAPYAVFIVPSLADNVDTKPYDLLRTTAVAERLRTVLRGRIAVWSGTPDQGTTNRTEKSTLIRNLVLWGAANHATSGLRGLVVLQDHSDTVAQRYAWLRGVSRLSVAADSDLQIYNAVQALTAIAAEILRNGDQQLAYANMASFGLEPPADSGGATADARGAGAGQVVLVSIGNGNMAATVKTDKEDYAPGEVVTITGSGWQPGEAVTLELHEDLDHDEDTDQTLTTTADSSGNILSREFAPDEHDLGVRFYLTATGQTSRLVAQTTFLDSPKVGSVTVGAQSPDPVTSGSSAAFTITVFRGSGGGSSGNFTATLSITTALPSGASASFSVNPVALASSENSKTSTLTISTTSGTTPAATTSFTVQAATSVSDLATGSGTLRVGKQNPTVTFSGAPTSAGYGTTFTVASSTNSSASPVYTASGACSNGSGTTTYSMTSGTGTCTATATWAADANYNGATRSQTTTATKIDPTVTFTGAPATAAHQSTFTVASSTNSSASPVYTASGVCSNGGATTYTMTTGTGTCTSTATWAADANYNGATRSQTTTATKIDPTVTFTGAPASAGYGTTFAVASSTTSSASPVYTAGGVCSNGSGTTTYSMTSGTGSCTSTATWVADANYNGASRRQTTTETKIDRSEVRRVAKESDGYGTTFAEARSTTSSASPVYTAGGVCSNG